MTSHLVLTLLLAGPAPAPGIQWEQGFDRAMKLARKHDRPVLVDFSTQWCGLCRRLERSTYVEPLVVARADSFIAVKVNAEGSPREREVVREYGIRHVPTILFLSPRGRQVMRVEGFQGPGQFPRTMDAALETARRVGAWEEALEHEANDAAALSDLGVHLWNQRCYEESFGLLRRAARHDGLLPASDRRRTRLLLAVLLNAQGRYAEAETVIKEALTLGPKAPDRPTLLYILGYTYVSWGRRAEGVQTLRVLVSEHPQSPIAPKAREKLFDLEQEK
jgi:thioredoxin-like negative regulator of GroEL